MTEEQARKIKRLHEISEKLTEMFKQNLVKTSLYLGYNVYTLFLLSDEIYACNQKEVSQFENVLIKSNMVLAPLYFADMYLSFRTAFSLREEVEQIKKRI